MKFDVKHYLPRPPDTAPLSLCSHLPPVFRLPPCAPSPLSLTFSVLFFFSFLLFLSLTLFWPKFPLVRFTFSSLSLLCNKFHAFFVSFVKFFMIFLIVSLFMLGGYTGCLCSACSDLDRCRWY